MHSSVAGEPGRRCFILSASSVRLTQGVDFHAEDIFPPETRATIDRLKETLETARREHEAERRANMTLADVQRRGSKKERVE